MKKQNVLILSQVRNVTKSDVKKYLSRVKVINDSIDALDMAIKSLGEHDVSEYPKAEKLMDDMKEEKRHLLEVKTDIVSTINKVENARQRKLLTARFLEFRNWEEIPDIIDASESTTWRDYRSAILAVSKILEE